MSKYFSILKRSVTDTVSHKWDVKSLTDHSGDVFSSSSRDKLTVKFMSREQTNKPTETFWQQILCVLWIFWCFCHCILCLCSLEIMLMCLLCCIVLYCWQRRMSVGDFPLNHLTFFIFFESEVVNVICFISSLYTTQHNTITHMIYFTNDISWISHKCCDEIRVISESPLKMSTVLMLKKNSVFCHL